MKPLLIALGLAIAGATASCNPFVSDAGLDPMTIDPQGGSIEVIREGEPISVTGRFALEAGDGIDTGPASARLHLEGDRFAQLAAGTRITLLGGSSMENEEGEVLLDTSEASTVSFDDVEVSTTGGMIRVEQDRGSGSAAVIDGAARVVAPGQVPEQLERLFEVSVVSGDVLDPRPYRIDDRDAWDRRHLPEVVELELQLQRYADALRAQTAEGPRSDYFSEAADGEDVSFIRSYLQSETPTTDLLIGFSIANVDRDPSIAASFREAFALREEGGQWGVVSSVMGVASKLLLADLERLGSDLLAAGEGRATGVSFGRPSEGGDGSSGRERGDGAGDEAGDGGPSTEACDNVVDCTLQNPSRPTPDADESGLP